MQERIRGGETMIRIGKIPKFMRNKACPLCKKIGYVETKNLICCAWCQRELLIIVPNDEEEKP